MLFALTGSGLILAQSSLPSLLIPFLILLLAIAFIVVVMAVASRYKKVPPNAVLIVYGRKTGHKGTGFRIVSGGGSLVYPLIEDFQEMSTAAFQVSINEQEIPNKDNVPVNVRGVASCKIGTNDDDLANAAQAFLGQAEDEMHVFVANILMGHLRSIIGKLDISDILRNRDIFNQRVISESTEELKRLGIQVITLVIQDVSDTLGYIQALGKQAVAEAIRDADIKVAQAHAATKKMVSDADRDAQITVANNAVAVAEAQKNRDVSAARFRVAADTETAKGNTALSIATAEQQQILKVKEAERDAAEKQAQIAVQQKEAQRKQQELDATVVKPAEAEKKKRIIEAQAKAEALQTEAEGVKQAKTLEGQGEAAKMTAEAGGQAAMRLKILMADAEGEAAKMKQLLMAEAEGEAAKKKLALLGEAEGTAALAKALAQMTESARLLLIMDRLPVLLSSGGDAMSKVAEAVFSSVAAPLGRINELRIIDFGGNGNGLSQVAGIVPKTVFQVLAALTAQGINIEPFLAKLGIRFDDIAAMVGANGNGAAHTAPIAEAARESTIPAGTDAVLGKH